MLYDKTWVRFTILATDKEKFEIRSNYREKWKVQFPPESIDWEDTKLLKYHYSKITEPYEHSDLEILLQQDKIPYTKQWGGTPKIQAGRLEYRIMEGGNTTSMSNLGRHVQGDRGYEITRSNEDLSSDVLWALTEEERKIVPPEAIAIVIEKMVAAMVATVARGDTLHLWPFGTFNRIPKNVTKRRNHLTGDIYEYMDGDYYSFKPHGLLMKTEPKSFLVPWGKQLDIINELNKGN